MKIGKFTIHESHNDKNQIYIGLDNGEGGDFSEEKVSEWIEKFYQDNF